MRIQMKRIVAMMLVAMMTLTMMPTSVLAEAGSSCEGVVHSKSQVDKYVSFSTIVLDYGSNGGNYAEDYNNEVCVGSTIGVNFFCQSDIPFYLDYIDGEYPNSSPWEPTSYTTGDDYSWSRKFTSTSVGSTPPVTVNLHVQCNDCGVAEVYSYTPDIAVVECNQKYSSSSKQGEPSYTMIENDSVNHTVVQNYTIVCNLCGKTTNEAEEATAAHAFDESGLCVCGYQETTELAAPKIEILTKNLTTELSGGGVCLSLITWEEGTVGLEMKAIHTAPSGLTAELSYDDFYCGTYESIEVETTGIKWPGTETMQARAFAFDSNGQKIYSEWASASTTITGECQHEGQVCTKEVAGDYWGLYGIEDVDPYYTLSEDSIQHQLHTKCIELCKICCGLLNDNVDVTGEYENHVYENGLCVCGHQEYVDNSIPTIDGLTVTPEEIALGESIAVSGTVNGNGGTVTRVRVSVFYNEALTDGKVYDDYEVNSASFDLSNVGSIIAGETLAQDGSVLIPAEGTYWLAVFATNSNGNGQGESPVLKQFTVKNKPLSTRYTVYNSSMTWKEAKEYCEAQGGHLATITSQSEQEAIEAVIAAYGEKNMYWIGLYSDGNNNNWYWITGENFSYSNWRPGEPNSSREVYGEIYGGTDSSTGFYWNDSTNTAGGNSFHNLSNHGFICEWGSYVPETPETITLESTPSGEIVEGTTVSFAAESNSDSVTLYIDAFEEGTGNRYTAVEKEMTKGGTTFTAENKFTSAGKKIVWAMTADGTKSAEIEIIVVPAEIKLDTPVYTGATTATVGEPITFSWTVVDNATGYTAYVRPVNNTDDVTNLSGSISGQSVSHTFIEAGSYNLEIYAVGEEGYGASDACNVTITVTNPAPCSHLNYRYEIDTTVETQYRDTGDGVNHEVIYSYICYCKDCGAFINDGVKDEYPPKDPHVYDANGVCVCGATTTTPPTGPVQLATPVVTLTGLDSLYEGDTTGIVWNKVPNATLYALYVWNDSNVVDYVEYNLDAKFEYSHTFDKAGTYVIGVYACAPSSTDYLQSEVGSVNITVAKKPTAKPAEIIGNVELKCEGKESKAGERFSLTVVTNADTTRLVAVNNNSVGFQHPDDWTKMSNGDGTYTWIRSYKADVEKKGRYWTVTPYNADGIAGTAVKSNKVDIAPAVKDEWYTAYYKFHSDDTQIPATNGTITIDYSVNKYVIIYAGDYHHPSRDGSPYYYKFSNSGVLSAKTNKSYNIEVVGTGSCTVEIWNEQTNKKVAEVTVVVSLAELPEFVVPAREVSITCQYVGYSNNPVTNAVIDRIKIAQDAAFFAQAALSVFDMVDNTLEAVPPAYRELIKKDFWNNYYSQQQRLLNEKFGINAAGSSEEEFLDAIAADISQLMANMSRVTEPSSEHFNTPSGCGMVLDISNTEYIKIHEVIVDGKNVYPWRNYSDYTFKVKGNPDVVSMSTRGDKILTEGAAGKVVIELYEGIEKIGEFTITAANFAYNITNNTDMSHILNYLGTSAPKVLFDSCSLAAAQWAWWVTITEYNQIPEVFEAVGFIQDSEGVYHTSIDCWQQYCGYTDLYDSVFNIGTDMERLKLPFHYNGDEYILWGWKGDYLNLGAGAELGIYIKTPTNISSFYDVDVSKSMPMSLRLLYNGEEIIDWSPQERQWWVTGFNPEYYDIDVSKLTAIFTVTFEDKAMYAEFDNQWRYWTESEKYEIEVIEETDSYVKIEIRF